MINTVIVDDEQLARAELAFLLRAFPDVVVLAEARNGTEAFKIVSEKQPDLVFLDINMPGQGGLDVARKLLAQRGHGKLPHFIFATAYDQHALQAFEVNAVDYLLKPIENTRLAASLQRVRDRMQNSNTDVTEAESALQGLFRSLKALPMSAETITPAQKSKVLVRSAKRMLLVDPSDLIFATTAEGRVWLVAKECEGESTFKSLEDLQAALPAISFWRAHRSHLVNIAHIREVVPWFKSTYQVRMDDRKNTPLSVSRAQTKRLKELFNL